MKEENVGKDRDLRKAYDNYRGKTTQESRLKMSRLC